MFARPYILGLMMLLLVPLSSHAQFNSSTAWFDGLNRYGIIPSVDFYTDILAGRDSKADVRGAPVFLDLSATLAFGHMSHALAGTSGYISVHVNQNVAGEFSSSIQSISSIQAASGVRVAELWMEQELRPDIHLVVGKIDANRDFAFVENGSGFLNAAAGFTPTFVTLPNYNESRPGAELLWKSRRFHLNLAAFSPIEGTGVLVMSEVGTTWNPRGWNGRLAGGYWKITGAMPTLAGWNRSGSKGVYAVAEQKIWRQQTKLSGTEQSLALYLQLGESANEFSPMPRQAALGILWSAPLQLRSADAAGFSCSRGQSIAYEAASRTSGLETAWETFYRVHVSSVFSLTPDFQYIIETHDPRPVYSVGARISMNLHSGSE